MSLQVHDNFDRPGYSLADYSERWTRGCLLIALDRPDVFLSGDLALRHTIQHRYGFVHLPTDDELIELSDRRRPYRSLAVS
jgi:3-methyladenine DNA glycosylase/8-oxoguanine DNA glycosylase